MKRLVLSLVFAGAAALAVCQAPFTIVRPADNAKVREKVRVLIPKNSVPKTGYVGFFLDGKFVEAVIPNLSGRYYEYVLDTKGKGIADGKHTLEAVLYVDYSDEPRIVDRSSINLTIANKANIPIPADGLLLRYRFASGEQYTYTILQRTALNTISKNQQALGGRAAELPLDYEKWRLMYSIDNAYGNGDGLVRMQPQPLKNKRYTMVTPFGASSPQLFWDTDMKSVYMRLTNTGMEVFGSIPAFIPFEGIAQQGGTDLIVQYPLPTLPSKRVRPGDVWQTRFQVPKFNEKNPEGMDSVIDSLPARGEFVSMEWEMGHPCAKIHSTLAVGSGPAPKGGIANNRQAIDETVWFAVDKGMVIKTVRNYSFDVAANQAAPGRSGAGGGGKNGGGSRGGGGKNGGGAGAIDLNTPAVPLRQGKLGAGGGDRPQRPQQRPGNRSVTGTGRGSNANAAPAASSLVRLNYQIISILEQ